MEKRQCPMEKLVPGSHREPVALALWTPAPGVWRRDLIPKPSIKARHCTIFATRWCWVCENFFRTACSDAFSACCRSAHISFAHDLICCSV